MKKILFIAVLLFIGRGAYAQTGGLCIDNSNDSCGVWIQTFGTDTTVAADGVCTCT